MYSFLVKLAGFHWGRSRSRSCSRSRKRASDLVKIENRSHKRSNKLGGIGVGRIRTVPLDCPSHTQKRKNQLITMPGLFLRLRQSSFHWIISIGVINGIGRKWNRSDSAYDSDFRFSLGQEAFTTSTPTPSPWKTNL